MKCKRIGLIGDVVKYETDKGLEDGLEPWYNVVTNCCIVTDFLVKIEREDGMIVCPYITGKRGRTYIGVDDYIITDEDGTRHVCGADKIWKRYEKVEE